LNLDIGPFKVVCKNMFLKWRLFDVLLHFIVLFCLFYFIFIPCHVLSIMMFKCTLMKEQINHLKSKSMFGLLKSNGIRLSRIQNY
jgi:hypothetical protein